MTEEIHYFWKKSYYNLCMGMWLLNFKTFYNSKGFKFLVCLTLVDIATHLFSNNIVAGHVLTILSFTGFLFGLIFSAHMDLPLKNKDLKFFFNSLNDNSLKFFNEHMAKTLEQNVASSKNKILTYSILLDNFWHWRVENKKFLARQSGQENNLTNLSLMALSNREQKKIKKELIQKKDNLASIL